MPIDEFRFLSGQASDAAMRLLGCQLVRTFASGEQIALRIVETEAYDQSDVASHSYKGRTRRTEIMFGEYGYVYVYFTYGMHYCFNIVVGHEGYGAAVLIRAAEPLGDHTLLYKNRPGRKGVDLTNGPAKLCQALIINLEMNGHDISKDPLRLVIKPQLEADEIVTTTRIGISKAKDVPWRFYIKNNDYVSSL
ncbi:MAG TPA: DNA-3-methyladenine glycosylase [Candidatus Saccharimonadales bacterium]|nr:DNA-3-methyladenine glycosylase [Candidatus Saccharimonadales bacterium]